MLIAGYWFTANVKDMCTSNVGHRATHGHLCPCSCRYARHSLWGQQGHGTLDLLCTVHWIQQLPYDTTVQMLHFPLHFVTSSLPKQGNNWVWHKPISAHASDFFAIASVRRWWFFFFNGYSGVTQQLKGKTFKYLMSLNCSETGIFLFLQLWVNIMDCERRRMIMWPFESQNHT